MGERWWYLRVGWACWGGNNSSDFPNLARSRMWMAALERNCIGLIWLSVCFFIGRKDRERESRKTEEGRGGRACVSCHSTQMMEEVQNKLFHSDELKVAPAHFANICRQSCHR